jgi:hypothetical protein
VQYFIQLNYRWKKKLKRFCKSGAAGTRTPIVGLKDQSVYLLSYGNFKNVFLGGGTRTPDGGAKIRCLTTWLHPKIINEKKTGKKA